MRAPYRDFPYVDFLASLDEVATEYRNFPPIALTIITATRGFAGDGCTPGLPCAEMQAVWLDLQADYASLRPDARHVEAPTGHYVHDEDPDLVVTEILRLLDSI